MIPRQLRATILVALFCSSTACLKTRAQLKEDHDDPDAKPQPAQVTEVKPEGSYVIDEIKAEMTRMNGRIEDVERSQQQGAASAANAKQDDMKKLEQRIVELEQAQANMLEAIKKLQNQEEEMTADPAEILQKAKAQMDSGNLDGAVETLSGFLKSPRAKKLEEATFMRAEAYFGLKDYKKAIVDYSKFPEKFTRSHFMPQALFKIGQSFDALGMRDDARGFYQELVEKFPKSSEAKKARSKLK